MGRKAPAYPLRTASVGTTFARNQTHIIGRSKRAVVVSDWQFVLHVGRNGFNTGDSLRAETGFWPFAEQWPSDLPRAIAFDLPRQTPATYSSSASRALEIRMPSSAIRIS